MEKELKAAETINKTKSDELTQLKGKLMSSEDIQERIHGQIVRDANQISNLGSQISLLSKEPLDVKPKSQEVVSSYCEFVTAFSG